MQRSMSRVLQKQHVDRPGLLANDIGKLSIETPE
jgi:hypothetical protein